MIWIIKTYVLFLRCKDTQESDQNPLPDDMMKRLPVKDFQDIPHQSKLGNSSKFKEMPRQAFPSMAGPAPKGVDLWSQGGLQRLESTQILSFGVSSHSFGVDLKAGESQARSPAILQYAK